MTQTCDFNIAGQACYHYSSVIKNNPASSWDTLPCPFDNEKCAQKTHRPWVATYRKEHDAWSAKVPGSRDCQRDEYPPANFLAENDGRSALYKDYYEAEYRGTNQATVWQLPGQGSQQYIRFLNAADNNAGGNLFGRCVDRVGADGGVTSGVDYTTHSTPSTRVDCAGKTEVWVLVTRVYTRHAVSLVFANTPRVVVDDGLYENTCTPSQAGVDHRGFALLNEDPWFRKPGRAANAALTSLYSVAPMWRRDSGPVARNGMGRALDEEVEVDVEDNAWLAELEARVVPAETVATVTGLSPRVAIAASTEAASVPDMPKETGGAR
ncbi:uncharacterized protein BDZ99DRAFT_468904 [Mytilinidion resinicola]|uniref:Uncharacterized protein n=1 Tax=Mytilinidion resinicola TaxID=574789 RepID=A0A6A6Y1C2_9PEZI|nr:uncharacterized protein BDZ99DRAFT_468904 [Mytilinidion resinicola]KAF2802439.1 hypothetical protein BDZ99DRAFT_468904 [Mytilinidion resinicola]